MTYNVSRNNIQTPPEAGIAGFLNPCDGVLSIISPQAGVNYCTNPSFEIDTTGWTNVVRVLYPWVGAWSGAVSGVVGTATYAAPSTFSIPLSTVASFYARANTTLTTYNIATVTFQVFSGATVIGSGTFQIDENWRRCVVSYPATTGITLSISTASSIYIDAVQIEYALPAVASTYFDGDSTGYYNNAQVPLPPYAWQYKPHNSFSTRDRNAANGGTLINLQNDLGLIITGVIGADNPAQNNQIVRYNQSDGAMLQDSLIPDRQVSFIGQISGIDKNDLMRKLALFSKYFSRDTVANRQPKYFVFQHKANRQLVGQPMYFSGVITNAMQVPVTNTLNVNVSVTITMIDPFFYGHSESVQLAGTLYNGNSQYLPQTFNAGTIPTRNFFTFANNSLRIIFSSTANLIPVNADMTAITTSPVDGTIVIGYSDGTILTFDGTQFLNIYDPINAYNLKGDGAINALQYSPDGADLWIGGAFSTMLAGRTPAVTHNRIAIYNAGLGVLSVGAGAGGGFNNTVTAIAIRKTRIVTAGAYSYDVFIGGAFTATTSGTTVNRIAYLQRSGWTYGTGVWAQIGSLNGMNAQVNALAYNDNQERLYIGGAFTTSQGGAANAFPYICYINYSALATTVAFYTGFNNTVNCIYANPVDNSVWVGGAFTQLFSGVTMNLAAGFNGSTWSQLGAGLYGTSVTWITPFKNGLFLCGQVSAYDTNLSSNLGAAWYNYNSVFPMPFNAKFTTATGYFNRAVTRGDGVLCLGIASGSFIQRGIMPGSEATATNTGSAAASINWMFYQTDTSISDYRILQVANQTEGTQISFTNLLPQYLDIITINTRQSTITSNLFGNLLRTMQSGSNLSTMSVLPGNNTLICGYYTVSTSYANNYIVVAYWRQTFNNLFDGASVT